MGFKESEESVSLLTCLVCNEGFGLTSLYCGECGAHRNVALGIERSAPKTSTPKVPVYPGPAPVTPGQPTPFVAPIPAPEISDREPSWVMNLNDRLLKHGRFVTGFGAIAVIASLFMVTQTIVYANSSPNDEIEKYISAVATHDLQYFTSPTLTPKLSTTAFLPSQFNQWPDASHTGWVRSVSWSGWSSSASSLLTPANSSTSIKLDLTSSSKSATLGLIHSLTWSVKGPMATLQVKYPTDKNLPIFINGIAAGTTFNPAVAPGKYYVFPGPLTFSFGSSSQGSTKVAFEIGSSGEYNFPN